MRHGWLLCGVLAIACTRTVADDYALEDERLAMWSEGELVPDGEEVVAPAIEPAIDESEVEVEPARAQPERERPYLGPPRISMRIDPETCFPSYTAKGFPAIDVDAGLVVVPIAWVQDLSFRPGQLDLVWFDAATGHEMERDILLGDDFDASELDDDEGQSCRDMTAGLRHAVDTANVELGASGSWTTMAPLPVELYDGRLGSDDVYREYVAPRDRPVQVLVQHGHAVARVAGIEVLERHDIPNRMTMVHRVYAHRPSGTVLFVTRDCEGDSCTCDPRSRAVVLRWKAETFAAIDSRPCVPEDRPGEDDVGCDWRGIPFADAADTPLWEL